MIKFNQNLWLQPYIAMNTDLKNDFEKDILKFTNNAVFRKNRGKCEKTKMLNLLQQKEEENIWYKNQIVILQSFSQNISYILAIEMNSLCLLLLQKKT